MWEISYQPSPAAWKLNHANAHLTLLIISRSRMTAPLHFPFREKGRGGKVGKNKQRRIKTESVFTRWKCEKNDQ